MASSQITSATSKRVPNGIPKIAKWLFPRLVLRVGLLISALGLVFISVDRLPGNAAVAILGANRTPEALAAMETTLGLNQPLYLRYGNWLLHALTGDFGSSVHGRSISELLIAAIPVTLVTTGSAFILTLLCSTALSMWWATRTQKSLATSVTDWTTVSVIALPEFVVGVFLIAVFSLGLGILPAVTITAGHLPTSASMYVLPVVSLVIPQVAWNSRVLRAALTDALLKAPVRNAVLNGIVGQKLMLRHVLPAALPTFAASMATSAGVLVAGTVAVEALFNHPGVGLLVATAVSQRDISVLLAVLLVTGGIILLLLTVSDFVKVAFTPKVQV